MKDLLFYQHAKHLGHQIEEICGSPFIIIGMHRSGTSLVTRLLRKAGGYFGAKLDPNSEALSFMRLNIIFLSYLGATWDVIPPDFDSPTLTSKVRVWFCLLLNKHLLRSDFFQCFVRMGKEGYSLNKEEFYQPLPLLNVKELLSLSKWPVPKNNIPFWGWKYPRTTLTFPFWLEMFPMARVIHVIRNGIDVSLSLWRRCQISGEGKPHCLDVKNCFNLWEYYVKEGIKWRTLPDNRYWEIHYEEILRNPLPSIRQLISFVGVSSVDTESLISTINFTNRRSSQEAEFPELLEYAARSDLFCQLGYDKDLQPFNNNLSAMP